mmetsp:Transcript_3960/g.10947  ORF Transcript_3960/g.10947 Transcript_3960/m.10947 type:complete len:222 (+) Transcript_3960:451-1116(+)
MNEVHRRQPVRLSRRSMSCMPSQFEPRPSLLSDHGWSPFSDVWYRRNASPVFSSARSSLEPLLNLVLNTAIIPSHLQPYPLKSKSSVPLSCCDFCLASSPESKQNSCATGQNFRAWKAASAFRKLFFTPWASSDMPSAPMSKELLSQLALLNSSQGSSRPGKPNATTSTSWDWFELGRGSQNLMALGLGSVICGGSGFWTLVGGPLVFFCTAVVGLRAHET